MLTNPLAVPDVVAMDGVGNVETITAMRMVTVRLVPRASYVPGGDAAATAAAKDVVVLEVPCSLTVRDVGAELLRATHSPTVAQRVREWLGVRAAACADASSAGVPAVHMYVEERCADSAELVPVAPLLRLDELVSGASDVDASGPHEVTLLYAHEDSLGDCSDCDCNGGSDGDCDCDCDDDGDCCSCCCDCSQEAIEKKKRARTGQASPPGKPQPAPGAHPASPEYTHVDRGAVGGSPAGARDGYDAGYAAGYAAAARTKGAPVAYNDGEPVDVPARRNPEYSFPEA